MSADDRKKRIMEHLTRSSESMKSLSGKKTAKASISGSDSGLSLSSVQSSLSNPSTSGKLDDRKKRIMDHVSRSSGSFGDFSLDSEQRRKQIQNHLRVTKG